MEKATICIDTGKPCGAVIIRVFITSKGVVTTAASPPDKAPTVTVSQDLPSWGMNSINSVKETVESVDFKRSTFDNGMFNNPLAIFCGELLAVSSLSPPVA
ncbi:hypothetical protein MUK42_03755 [Musa troglodytarum]|uniref:Uncharacterized protein n=1 Tax=Musa troglodytarum TaxID=320322 RepID=A0A9E7K1U7_9LILI|nr:hypothetical protein MUK42_03755 [Musa troglodytarum]